MNITVIGAGYVGLVTAISLAETKNNVTCIDIDMNKIEALQQGRTPIYEVGLEKLLKKNLKEGRITFKNTIELGVNDAEIIYLAVGTPQSEDGSANMNYMYEAVDIVAKSILKDTIFVVKSTVPIGENSKLEIRANALSPYQVTVVSNPEFLREGTAIQDVFNGERIILGANNKEALDKLVKVNEKFETPIVKTTLESAEMIKYASNAFLAMKISYINEIANLSEMVGANISEVSLGMGLDKRIGHRFLQAGVGYGGSCFPKDTHALLNISEKAGYDFRLIKEVIHVNRMQRERIIIKLLKYLPSLVGKKIAVLGVTFKPDTDDIRDAPSLDIIGALEGLGAEIAVYDPIFSKKMGHIPNIASMFNNVTEYTSINDALLGADAALVITDWEEIKNIQPNQFLEKMLTPIIIDGRQCYNAQEMDANGIIFDAVGLGGVTIKDDNKVKVLS
ncbi:UDP-glucose/GDP-mannose dehydrogenase family protein [Listeria rocourtiae]|uniref:UDP-glucose dehydrogenase family protein n=1 Tax=Listeria rocourtiae TaxID=647910 RepID=UPI001625F076|nr:UDP-glucose/GDP-mannose dehydrogenase family protein [Listeria rocourtiae]MBC1605357.1 UDP-glucose/GDP-mannose dehydrogenase family protein [Listeria rocourtiae]